jgi:hypothetical protein
MNNFTFKNSSVPQIKIVHTHIGDFSGVQSGQKSAEKRKTSIQLNLDGKRNRNFHNSLSQVSQKTAEDATLERMT